MSINRDQPDLGKRLYIQRRDSSICQLCFISSRDLEIHHIDYDRSNSDEFNLITLCRQCHYIVSEEKADKSFYIERFTKRVKDIYISALKQRLESVKPNAVSKINPKYTYIVSIGNELYQTMGDFSGDAKRIAVKIFKDQFGLDSNLTDILTYTHAKELPKPSLSTAEIIDQLSRLKN